MRNTIMSIYNDSSFDEYESLLIDLSDAIRLQDNHRADEIRRRMEGPERKLTNDMMERLDGLAADLYMLSDSELFERADPYEAVPGHIVVELRSAWESEDWTSVLTILRKRMPFLSAEHRAYLRAVAYDKLGQPGSAFRFMDYASHINPADQTYQYFALAYLNQSGNAESAAFRAGQQLDDPKSAPTVIIGAAATLVQTSRNLPRSDFVSRASRVIPFVTDILNNEASLSGTPREVIALAYVTLGFCLAGLGDFDKAGAAYKVALEVDPGNGPAQVALGTLVEDQEYTNSVNLEYMVPTTATNANLLNVKFELEKANQIWAEAV